jgi:hypothetical protein
MGTTYEMQQEFEDMHTLLTQDRFRCILQGMHSLRNLQLPPLLRVKTFWVLVQAEDDWHKAEVSCEPVDDLGVTGVLTRSFRHGD